MKRPAGVTAAAVVAALGSLFALFVCVVMVFGVSAATQSRDVAVPLAALAVVLIFGVGLAALGLATSIGLLKLKRWARTSILVFAGIMGSISLVAAIGMAFMPIPPTPGAPAGAVNVARTMLVTTYIVPVLIAVWWLVYFNRPATKAAFTTPGEVEPPARPLAVSIIGWWCLIGGVGTIGPVIMGMPAYVGGVVVTDTPARLLYVFYTIVGLWIGRELLRLNESARVAAIVWFGFTVVQTLVIVFVPGQMDKVLAFQGQFAAQSAPAPAPTFDIVPFMRWIMGASSLIAGAMMLLLVRAKSAFTAEDPAVP